MRRAPALLLLLLLAWYPAAGQELEPDEPQIVLPEVVLRIEDLSVETVEATLPGLAELEPPERAVPLPDREELVIREPEVPAVGEEIAGEPRAASRGYALAAQALLGAGSVSHVVSSITLYRTGDEPRFRLRFLHEMLDGFGGKEAGSGFGRREDSLEGGLKFHLGGLELDTSAAIRDEEQGLQDQGPFVSRVFRGVSAQTAATLPLGEHFYVGADLQGASASQLLSGVAPEGVTELSVTPALRVGLTFPRFRAGLKADYAYQGLLDGSGSPVHRVSALASIGVDPLPEVQLEGSGGWFWSSALGHLFPFALTVTGTPFSALTFRISGGYRVERLQAMDVLSEYPLVSLPAAVLDTHGWFGELSLSFLLLQGLSLETGMDVGMLAAVPEPDVAAGVSPATGLYTLVQRPADRLGARAGLRWNIGTALGLSAEWSGQFLHVAPFAARHLLRVSAETGDAAALWGGRASLEVPLGAPSGVPFTPMPLLSLEAHYKVSDAIAIRAEGEDLLYLLVGGPRYSWYPFREPGMRFTAKIEITL